MITAQIPSPLDRGPILGWVLAAVMDGGQGEEDTFEEAQARAHHGSGCYSAEEGASEWGGC